MKYIASCSFGKDSIATILLAREHNEPLDEIVYCEVMFDKEISGELPEHRDFIYNKAIPTFESWGYKVTIIRGKTNYIEWFNKEICKGQNIGKSRGFPMAGRCGINRDCKSRPCERYLRTLGDFAQYMGIAFDEKKRLERMDKKQVSLLEKYRYTEEMAKEKCLEYGLLSPIYKFTSRGAVGSVRTQGIVNYGI